jgi:hypothetical protein
MHRLGIPRFGYSESRIPSGSNDRRSRIDDELPGIVKAKERTCDQLEYYDPSGRSEYDRMSGGTRRLFCKIRKP